MDYIDKNTLNNIIEKKSALIVTHLYESPSKTYTHYSGIKGFLLGKGLIDNGYNTFILSNDLGIIRHNNFDYIHYKLLSENVLMNFDLIIFCLHNKEILKPLHINIDIFNKVLRCKDKNKNLKVINKTCQYPSTLDYIGIDSYSFFDKIFLQTDNIVIPSLISNKLNALNKLTVGKLREYLKEQGIKSKIESSEMTFDINYDKNKTVKFEVNKDTVNIVYLGRLMGNKGMDIIYLIKLMKRLGKKYMLYIMPGSFVLPTDFPLKKKSAIRQNQFNELKTFFEKYEIKYHENNIDKHIHSENYSIDEDDYNVCNINVLPQYEYGYHFEVIKQMDLGLGFSSLKTKKVPEGSSKLFDYMCSNIRIVFEDGWDNTKYIEKYNFGKCLSLNSKVSEAVSVIEEVLKIKKKDINYNNFIEDHNYMNRCNKILKNIE
jgi:hypothetical protein